MAARKRRKQRPKHSHLKSKTSEVKNYHHKVRTAQNERVWCKKFRTMQFGQNFTRNCRIDFRETFIIVLKFRFPPTFKSQKNQRKLNSYNLISHQTETSRQNTHIVS